MIMICRDIFSIHLNHVNAEMGVDELTVFRN